MDSRSVNVVVLVGRVATDPVARTMPTGDEVCELRVSVSDGSGERLLPLPVAVWKESCPAGFAAAREISKGSEVIVYGKLVRRFYRSGAGARSLTEVVASGLKLLDSPADDRDALAAEAVSIAGELAQA